MWEPEWISCIHLQKTGQKKYRKRLTNTSIQKKYSTVSDYSIIDFVNDLCSSSSISSLRKIQHSFYPHKWKNKEKYQSKRYWACIQLVERNAAPQCSTAPTAAQPLLAPHLSSLVWALCSGAFPKSHFFGRNEEKLYSQKNITVLKLHFRPFSKYKWLVE